MKPLKYRLYVDEVGNPDLDSSDNPNHRFLSLTGVALELTYVMKEVHPLLEDLKNRYFSSHPDEPVILHRKEMVNAQGSFSVLKDEAIKSQFDTELLGLLEAWEYTVITVCIDKKRHREQYSVWRHDPYHYCMKVLLERFVMFLKRHKKVGDVMAESRGGKEDMRLKKSFNKLWNDGSEFVFPLEFQKHLTSRDLKVRPKTSNISGLQIVDLLAHPSREEILYEQKHREKELAPFAKRVIGVLQKKYDQINGQIYGKKFI